MSHFLPLPEFSWSGQDPGPHLPLYPSPPSERNLTSAKLAVYDSFLVPLSVHRLNKVGDWHVFQVLSISSCVGQLLLENVQSRRHDVSPSRLSNWMSTVKQWPL